MATTGTSFLLPAAAAGWPAPGAPPPAPPAACEILSADVPPVGLQLGLAGAAGADGALLALQVGPHAQQPGQQILVLGQLHLEPALPGPGPLGEDVQDQGRPVQHLDAQVLRQRPLLGGREGIVKDHHVGPHGLHQLLDLRRLALADKGAGVRGVLVLEHACPRTVSPRRSPTEPASSSMEVLVGVFLRGTGSGRSGPPAPPGFSLALSRFPSYRPPRRGPQPRRQFFFSTSTISPMKMRW